MPVSDVFQLTNLFRCELKIATFGHNDHLLEPLYRKNRFYRNKFLRFINRRRRCGEITGINS